MSRSKSNAIYVLSNPGIKGLYKVGKHTGDIGKIYSRYSTYIPLRFEDVDATAVESAFKEKREKIKHTGNLSEWFKLSLDKIIADLLIMLPGTKHGLHKNRPFKILCFGERFEKKIRVVTPKATDREDADETSSEES